VVGVIGGVPRLPTRMEWPEWEGHGPLSFVAGVDCRAIAGQTLDIALPKTGELLFFYFDGQYDNGNATVGYWDPATLAGARVLQVAAEEGFAPRDCPPGISPYERVDLTAAQVVTFPTFEHHDLQAVFRPPGDDLRAFLRHPVNDDAFQEALHERFTGPGHQIGGYATPVQGPVEYEVSQAALGGHVRADDPALAAETANWTLLAQIDSDDSLGMMWGDVGTLYWLTRRQDLAEGRLEGSSFTWQCS
jgi:hypothetical protein